MNNIKIVIISCLAFLSIITYLLVADDVYHPTSYLHSTSGCCSIKVSGQHHVNDSIMYLVTYTESNSIDVDSTYSTSIDLDSTINMYQEYCYAHH